MLDTAVAYGDSETVLGAAIDERPFRVVTKLPADATTAMPTVRESLARLRIARLHGCLFHSLATYRRQPQLLDELAQHRDLVGRVGFSLYSPNDLRALLDEGVRFDLVQVPFNLFDRRFESLFPELRQRGVEIHVRSVFLQGLFFLDPRELPSHFEGVRSALLQTRDVALRAGLELSALLLGFALSRPFDIAVVGVDGLDNIVRNLDGARALTDGVRASLEDLAQNAPEILDASRWPKR